MRVCVIGLGYIGLPTAAMFATHGYQVTGADTSDRVIRALCEGNVHIREPGLEELVRTALGSGNLQVRSRPQPADAFIISVPTPCTHSETPGASPGKARPEADLSCVVSAVESIVPHLQPGNLVILESTVPPRTTSDVLRPIVERSGLQAAAPADDGSTTGGILLAHCPERVLPGRILDELVHNDRIIGGLTPAAAEKARSIYASFVEGQILTTEATTAEMVKLMENTYRDINIALANEFALVAERLGVDVWEAVELANRHPRVNILKPGPGVGGHCIAVDPWFIAQMAPDITPLIQTARHVNDGMAGHVVDLAKAAVAGIQEPVIACLGLTYKANVDDVRESPAMEVLRGLHEEGFEVHAFDPYVRQLPVLGACLRDSLPAAVAGADCALLLTDHAAFRSLTPNDLEGMRHLNVVDARHGLDALQWRALGRGYVTLGTGHARHGKEADEP